MKSLEIEREDMSDDALRMSCLLSAAPERVFDAWTQAEHLERWLPPDDSFSCTIHELDARVGGAFRWTIESPEEKSTAFGEFTIVDRPCAIEFTWQWTQSGTEKGISRVRVDLSPEGQRTRLVLTHDRLSGPKSRDLHSEGWGLCLGSLVSYVSPAKRALVNG